MKHHRPSVTKQYIGLSDEQRLYSGVVLRVGVDAEDDAGGVQQQPEDEREDLCRVSEVGRHSGSDHRCPQVEHEHERNDARHHHPPPGDRFLCEERNDDQHDELRTRGEGLGDRGRDRQQCLRKLNRLDQTTLFTMDFAPLTVVDCVYWNRKRPT